MFIHVKVRTGQKKEIVKQINEDHFLVDIKEKPERNIANKRIVQIFIEKFNVKDVRIINGIHSPSKLLSTVD